jgi:hypothetical protein
VGFSAFSGTIKNQNNRAVLKRKDIAYYTHQETPHFTRKMADNNEGSSTRPPAAPTGMTVARRQQGLKSTSVVVPQELRNMGWYEEEHGLIV